ncbi:RAB27b, member RAS oncogene family [Pelomyxa schiedti]|nr:RAB27b, member RAS oncogene family [Pelomyxa schiedti]
MSDDIRVELMVLGEFGVGKTSVVQCFLNDFKPCVVGGVGGGGVETATFEDREPDGFFKRSWKIGKKTITVRIWDSTGEEKFSHVTTSIFKVCKGTLIVYDLTEPDTLLGAKGWYNQLTRFSEVDSNSVVYLVGNKKDLPRKVVKSEAETLSANMHAEHYEVSAATGEMIQECLDSMIETVYKNLSAAAAATAKHPPRARAKGPRSIKKAEPKKGGCLLM